MTGPTVARRPQTATRTCGPAGGASSTGARSTGRSTATTVGRTAAEPIDLAGEHIPAGTTVLLSLWSADHDEAAFPRPEEIAVGANDTAPHVAFGHGAHHCLGAALARAELQEGLAALAERLECPRLEPGSVWKPPVGINGPDALPISFRLRAAAA